MISLLLCESEVRLRMSVNNKDIGTNKVTSYLITLDLMHNYLYSY